MYILERAKKEFIKYTKKFDLNNSNIMRKQQHSIRVMNISMQIAKSMKLNEEEIELADLIGLLHDIARFEQYTKFKTFNDIISFDHGDYGVEILDSDIRKYIEDDKFDNIIKKAIKNHNKYKIEDGLTEKEEMFCKIIRDADKIDIIYEATGLFWSKEEEKALVENSKILDRVLKEFKEKKTIKKGLDIDKKSINKVIIEIALIFDINYKESFKIIKYNDYIKKIVNRFNYKKQNVKIQMAQILELAEAYIEENI